MYPGAAKEVIVHILTPVISERTALRTEPLAQHYTHPHAYHSIHG